MFLSQCRNCFEIWNVETRIANRLQIDCFCFFVDVFFESLRFIAIRKAHINTQALEGNFELIVSTTV